MDERCQSTQGSTTPDAGANGATWGYVDMGVASLGIDFEIGMHGAVVLNGARPEQGERVVIAYLPASPQIDWAQAERLKQAWMKRAHRTLAPLSLLDSAAILAVQGV